MRAKRQLIHNHMQHCVDRRDASGGAVRELKELTKFL
jgi:DNA-binding FrmR family transcriptional regulator